MYYTNPNQMKFTTNKANNSYKILEKVIFLYCKFKHLFPKFDVIIIHKKVQQMLAKTQAIYAKIIKGNEDKHFGD